jgi:putative DNA primase/helicase
MIGAIAAAFSPTGISAQGVLVFQGPQNLGKTKWFKSLVPKEIGVIQDGVTLDPKDKDSVKQAVSNWLVELGEVDATFRKSDIAQLKSFLTRDKDVLRRAYAHKESKYPRRTVFFASVNPEFFLADPTGNKRYWTIKCKALDHSHSIDMQQVWAEFYEIYKTGESWYLTPDELDELNENNEQHETHDPITERIQTRLCWDDPESLWIWSTVTDVLYRCGFDRPTQADTSKAGIFLKKNPKVLTKRSNAARLILAPKERIRGE